MFVSVYATCMCTNEGQKRVLDPLELLDKVSCIAVPSLLVYTDTTGTQTKSVLLCKGLVNCKVLTPEAVSGMRT